MKRKKGLIAVIAVIVMLVFAFIGYNIYRYPAMPKNLTDERRTLIVYFSWSTSGNTEKMAAYIQEQTGGDLLELEPLNPYPTDYEECGDVALAERDENARPEIANLPDSISEYDTVFVGYAGGIIGLN